MSLPPLTFADLSLLFAVIAITLLVILEIVSPYLGQTNLIISRRKLRTAALTFSILFLITFVITTFNIIAGI